MFRDLLRINERPAPFAWLTTEALWTDPYISEQMLGYHLDGTIDLSSRRTSFIEASVAWIVETFGIGPGSRVVDLGCGPGLYTNRLAGTGARVTGVDFSRRSIGHAREVAERQGLSTTHVQADYLAWDGPGPFDLVLLIFCDYSALAPWQRESLLERMRRMIEPGGAVLFDVMSRAKLRDAIESASYRAHPGGGFWAPSPYFEFHNRFVYPDEAVTLDRYEIVEADRTRSFYNWLQHFDPESLEVELAGAGFQVDSVLGDVAGAPFDPAGREFAVVARLARSEEQRA